MEHLANPGLAALAGRILGNSVVSVLFKTLSRGHGSVAITAVFGLVGSIALSPFVLWMAWQNPSLITGLQPALPWLVLSSIFFTSGLIMFMWALRQGDINLLIPLTSLSFIFLYAMELATGSNHFSWLALSGILLVMLGLVMLNLSPGISLATALNPLAVIRRPGAAGALAYAFMLACCRMFDSRGVALSEPLPYALAGDVMVTVLAFLVLAVRRKLDEPGRILRESPLPAISASILGIGSYILLLVCFSYFHPSQIEPTSQISVMLAVLIGTIHFREPLHLRIPASLLICGGAVLVILS
ncbi:MAG: hypothetical protein H7A35_09910 [Planctomycetales bacterium]|nr:hypothetical protein [bacterium]UNM07190.1 MAG: hypothetical protein H7A35_09910 [Planctomycetales bacterium]